MDSSEQTQVTITTDEAIISNINTISLASPSTIEAALPETCSGIRIISATLSTSCKIGFKRGHLIPIRQDWLLDGIMGYLILISAVLGAAERKKRRRTAVECFPSVILDSNGGRKKVRMIGM
ncbi:hypothetical protein L1887_36139 [Cichorium endivia]|nr:hypothetical protein L1887_36139 [Cichorium endivia]